ncbi:MAG: DivIVA domain-containing protein [Candidatus Saccharibacteria bacterium]
MITPIEIRNHEFRRSIRGYTDTEVDSFMSRLADEFERVYRENAELKEAIQRSEFEMAKYKRIEETLNQTLVMAQQSAEDIRTNARREAEMMLESGRKKINEIFIAYEEVLKRLNVYRAEIKSMMSTQNELLDRQDKRIEELTSFFYSTDVQGMVEALSRSFPVPLNTTEDE